MSRRSRRSTERTPEQKRNRFITVGFSAALILFIAYRWWPEILAPVPLFGAPFWKVEGGLWTWIAAVWPIFAWGIGFNIVVNIIQHANQTSFSRLIRLRREPSSSDILVGGTLISIFAGVTEELTFRWVLYLTSIAMLVFANWLWGTVGLYIFLGVMLLILAIAAGQREAFLGFLTAGVLAVVLIFLIYHGPYIDPVKWFSTTVVVPIADFMSFGKMHNLLTTNTVTNPDAWAIGAAIIVANAKFRDGHKYLGLLGFVNSWYIGLVMFWLMFTFGLVAAIFCHFLYDFLIFATAAAMLRLRRGY